MLREIVLDTETTGLNPQEGDRVVEIGCVELINHLPTGKHHHVYINPQREMPEAAFRVHGLSDEFLSDKPVFAQVAEDFLSFIADSTLVIHNAPFDMGFLNFELQALGRPPLANTVIDTVQLARRKHPGARVGLDALCRHYGIDNSKRTLHGALLDSEILAEVYLELIGGRQSTFELARVVDDTPRVERIVRKNYAPRKNPVGPDLTSAQQEARNALLKTLGDEPLWTRYG